MDILIVAVVFIIVIAVAVVVVVCVNSDKKKQNEEKKRCTVRTTGTLLRVEQTYSMSSTEDHDNYYYDPVVRYEYNGQVYEKEYKSRSNLWDQVEVNTFLDVFINPEDENEIYVPIPDQIGKKNKNKNKLLIAFLILWIIIGGVGALLFK